MSVTPLRPRSSGRPDPEGASEASPLLPRAPRTLEDTGLPEGFVVELLLKTLLAHAGLGVRALAERVALPASLVAGRIDAMRRDRLVQLGSGGVPDVDATYRLTEPGQLLAHEAARRCAYCGPAPVPLAQYREVLAACAPIASPAAATVREALADVVADPALLDLLGAAVASRRAILLHGPAGSGKTHLAERLVRLAGGPVAVPHALHVAGEVVQVFDPGVHTTVASRDTVRAGAAGLADDADRRWVACRRPVVVSGGELTLEMLELRFDPQSRIHQAPAHLKANGGLYVIDDLGRQRVPAHALLNRWIVPLDRRADHLTLHTGHRFEVPFEATVVCSSNLDPDRLADDAFLRRFGYKVRVGALDADRYRRLVEIACARAGVAYDAEAARWLVERRHAETGRPLLAAWPGELVGRVRDLAAYERRPARLTIDALRRAWSVFFGDDEAGHAPRARRRPAVRSIAPSASRRVR